MIRMPSLAFGTVGADDGCGGIVCRVNRALAVLAAAAVLVAAVEATGPARTAVAVPLAVAFAVLSVLGFRWAAGRPRAAAAYFAGQLVLGYAVFDAADGGVGATLLLLVLVIQAVLVLPRPWALVVAALVPLMHIGMSWSDGLREIASTAVVVAFAVVLAVLYQDVQQARTALASANERLREYAAQAEELATSAERNRLAREIHDGLGHHLTVVQMQVRAARAVLPTDRERADEMLGKAEDQARAALADVRRSVGALREPWESVTAALRTLTAESAGVAASLEVRGAPRTLPADAERALYRAAQEALTNVRKHAGVDEARVLLDYSGPGVVRLRVSGDGRGSTAVPVEGSDSRACGSGSASSAAPWTCARHPARA
jgi:signal transduction histidine kinase